MHEFCHWDKIGSFVRLSLAEYAEICFDVLIHMLCFSICLWMVGGREFKIIPKNAGELCGKGGGKLRSSI